MEDPYQVFEQNLEYLEAVCEIQNHELHVIVTYHPYSFILYKDEECLLINTRGESDKLNVLLNIMKLFHMNESIIKLESFCCRGISVGRRRKSFMAARFSHKMDLPFITNKYYCMTFALALTRTSEQVEKFISDAVEKYMLLKQTAYLPIELAVEISTYLIEFILMCMM